MSYPMASETMKNVPPDDLDEEKQIRIKFKKFFFDFLFSKEITNNFLVWTFLKQDEILRYFAILKILDRLIKKNHALTQQ